MKKFVPIGIGALALLAGISAFRAGTLQRTAGAAEPRAATFEIIWGHELTFDGTDYYLNVNYQHRHEKAFACDANACLLIPKDKLDYARWKGWCWALPGHPKKWKLRIKEDLSGIQALAKSARREKDKVQVVEFSEKNQDFEFMDDE
jgi:hypothetical protein